MSSLLEEAIIDAKELRKAALGKAEAEIIDKYSSEVESALNKLLENNESDNDRLEDIPLAATEGEKEYGSIEEDEEIEISFDQLEKMMDEMDDETPTTDIADEFVSLDEPDMDEPDMDEPDMDEPDLEVPSSEQDEIEEPNFGEIEEITEKEEEFSDSLDDLSLQEIEDVLGGIEVDAEPKLSGWLASSPADVDYAEEMQAAQEALKGEKEKVKELTSTLKEAKIKNKNLALQAAKLLEAVKTLKDEVLKVNLENAKFLYENRILRDGSLNSRQKARICESLSKAGSEKEAKMIFETLKDVSASLEKGKKSLHEVVEKKSSFVYKGKTKEQSTVNPAMARMKKLAGIN